MFVVASIQISIFIQVINTDVGIAYNCITFVMRLILKICI